MHTLLRIPVSRRGEDSHSLELLERFTESFQRQHSETVVVDRDPFLIPHLDTLELKAGRTNLADLTPELREAFALASEVTDELLNASAVVIATPMFNWGPPSALKAWFDRVINKRTFYRETPALAGLPVTAIIASGGAYTKPDMRQHDSLRPLLRECFSRMGTDDLTFIDCEPTGPIDRGIVDRDHPESGFTTASAAIDEAAARCGSAAAAAELPAL